jgi:hypothetical protein
MLRVYRDDTTFTPRSDFRTRLRNSLHQILSVLALLIILAGLIAIRGWFLSGHINPEMQLPSNIGPYSNWKGGNSPVFNQSTAFDDAAGGHLESDASEILSGAFVVAVLALAVVFFGALVLVPIGRRLPGIGLMSRPVRRRPPVVGMRGLGFIDECSYQFSESGMVILRPFLDLHIAYDCVSRIERGPGSAPRGTEEVRVTFKRLGWERMLTFAPACPEVFVAELLAHCPHLPPSKYLCEKREAMLPGVRRVSGRHLGRRQVRSTMVSLGEEVEGKIGTEVRKRV